MRIRASALPTRKDKGPDSNAFPLSLCFHYQSIRAAVPTFPFLGRRAKRTAGHHGNATIGLGSGDLSCRSCEDRSSHLRPVIKRVFFIANDLSLFRQKKGSSIFNNEGTLFHCLPKVDGAVRRVFQVATVRVCPLKNCQTKTKFISFSSGHLVRTARETRHFVRSSITMILSRIALLLSWPFECVVAKFDPSAA